jgi:pyruvate formate lyase activating enzyme
MLTARIFDIHRATTHDGPGLRTTVFFKGCPLACKWCQNPEGIGYGPELQWHGVKCIQDYSCEAACELNALSHDDTRILVDRDRCNLCGACVEACPARAMTMSGTDYTVEALTREVLKDRKYFETFEGGVTASGGEPTSQVTFVKAFFKGLKEAGIHTALDTSGLTSRASLDALLPYTDCVLYDVKLLDDARHREFTGRGNEEILGNLKHVAEYIRANRKVGLWIRTPLIPGATASTENISQIAEFIGSNVLDVLERWELCSFNSLAREKYRKLNAAWDYETTALLSHSAAASMLAAAREHVPADKVSVTGILAEG